jgi:hypothetical protein
MTEAELKTAVAPFKVRRIGKRRTAIVIGFSQNDPLGVGGFPFPELPIAYFEEGGWLLVSDLVKHYELA